MEVPVHALLQIYKETLNEFDRCALLSENEPLLVHAMVLVGIRQLISLLTGEEDQHTPRW